MKKVPEFSVNLMEIDFIFQAEHLRTSLRKLCSFTKSLAEKLNYVSKNESVIGSSQGILTSREFRLVVSVELLHVSKCVTIILVILVSPKVI